MEKPIVLITGGSGYIGNSIINKLRDEFQVINLDLKPLNMNSPEVVHLKFDITSEKSLKSAFDHILKSYGKKIYSVIHLASYYNFDGKEHSEYEEVNVKGTERLLKELKSSFELGQFIFSSSMLAYAPTFSPDKKISEDSPLDASWAYPRSKIQCEEIIRKEHGNIPFVLMRIAAVYNDFGIAPSITQQILRIHELHLTSVFLPGDPNYRQSAIHVEDLADAIKLTIEKRNELPLECVFSVAEDTTPSYGELHQMISKLDHKKKFPLFWIPKSIAKIGASVLSILPGSRHSFIQPWMIKYADANYQLENFKIKRMLKWQPTRDLASTLPKILANLKEGPESWYKTNKIASPTIPSKLRTLVIRKLGGVHGLQTKKA